MGIIRTVRNIFGGKTFYDEDGELVGRSVQGVFGGETIFSKDGEVIARTVENDLGGETVYTYEQEETKAAPDKAYNIYDNSDDVDFSKYHRLGSITEESDEL